MILTRAWPAAVLALVIELLFEWIERKVSPVPGSSIRGAASINFYSNGFQPVEKKGILK
jgi:hypothetical protein